MKKGNKNVFIEQLKDGLAPNDEKKGFAAQNKNKRAAARKSDWKTVDMPKWHTKLTIFRKLTDEEYFRLQHGHIPKGMDDKWFCYFDNGKLFVHRSWSGYCLYILSFIPGSEKIDVVVNRDPNQYRCTDDEEDKRCLQQLLNWWVKPH